MCARSAYLSGSDNADAPKLRRFNELVHRVATYNRALVEGDLERLPEEAFVALICEELNGLGVESAGLHSMMVAGCQI